MRHRRNRWAISLANCDSDSGGDLYFLLIRRDDFPHRFFMGRNLFASSLQDIWRGANMLDIVLLALGLGLFVISIGYAYACDRL